LDWELKTKSTKLVEVFILPFRMGVRFPPSPQRKTRFIWRVFWWNNIGKWELLTLFFQRIAFLVKDRVVIFANLVLEKFLYLPLSVPNVSFPQLMDLLTLVVRKNLV